MVQRNHVVGRKVSLKKAQDWSLVLSSMQIEHTIARADARRASLVVDTQDLDLAEREIALWRRETIENRSRVFTENTAPAELASGGLVAVAVLLFLHLVMVGGYWPGAFDRGVLDVGRVGEGEVWRIVTAVSLHSDWGHLFSNLFFGWILLTALAMSIGNGRALCLTILGGVSANCVNVAIHSTRYVSLGFSNAVFAILGALVSLQLVRDRGGRRSGGILAVGAGLALFGLSGTGEGSDLTGHIAGFVSGLVLGVLPGFRQQDQEKKWGSLYGVATGALFVGAWLLAMSMY